MVTDILSIDPENIIAAQIQLAADALVAGQIVALPTETVYGLATRSDQPEALQRLIELKGCSPKRAFARLIAGTGELPLSTSRPARVIARRFLPGPVTLLLEGEASDWTGFRLPASEIARRIAAAAGVPLALTSANRSGGVETRSAEEVLSALGDDVSLIVDGGPAALGEPSTIVEVKGAGWRIVREGAVSEERIRQSLETRIVFVCTGNSCRSPMAEALCALKSAEKLGVPESSLEELGFFVMSCGTHALPGMPAADNALAVAAEHGSWRLKKHLCKQADPGVLARASDVIALAPSHSHWLARTMPELADRVSLLTEEGVSDPIGGSLGVYRRCAAGISEAIDPILRRIFHRDLWEGEGCE